MLMRACGEVLSVQHKPSQFVNSQASVSVCVVKLVPRTTPFLAMHRTATVLIFRDDQQRLLESCDLQMN